ncbi:MarR family winged helix-turn-helix transcriptional regulator [Aureimonas pseudogalii]|uniref:DNA-binding MarR family transcriptional regulator n=1 Tax=Aureimonas pseudogalii TaxID=1744844 RepID=A0A7W6H6C3_9HYPH|nr:MarR family transcriptional regulator [Aureimonas pseudogalii]MBB3999414.1 DNA-binding MarR family transcriptional regulator [Aureimonas pseudogalii]
MDSDVITRDRSAALQLGHLASSNKPQPGSAPASPSLLPLALSTAQAIRALLGLKLAPLGLSSGQDRLLIVLSRHPRMSVSALASELGVRPSTVSKMADRLIDKQLVQRSDDPVDRRRSFLDLTAQGHRLTEQVAAVCDNVEAELTAAVEDEEIGTMLKGVALLNGTVHQRLRRLR